MNTHRHTQTHGAHLHKKTTRSKCPEHAGVCNLEVNIQVWLGNPHRSPLMVEGAEFIIWEGAEWVELRLEEEGLAYSHGK